MGEVEGEGEGRRSGGWGREGGRGRGSGGEGRGGQWMRGDGRRGDASHTPTANGLKQRTSSGTNCARDRWPEYVAQYKLWHMFQNRLHFHFCHASKPSPLPFLSSSLIPSFQIPCCRSYSSACWSSPFLFCPTPTRRVDRSTVTIVRHTI